MTNRYGRSSQRGAGGWSSRHMGANSALGSEFANAKGPEEADRKQQPPAAASSQSSSALVSPQSMRNDEMARLYANEPSQQQTEAESASPTTEEPPYESNHQPSPTTADTFEQECSPARQNNLVCGLAILSASLMAFEAQRSAAA